MGAFLKLIGIEQPAESQALIKAPSADLIKSDNELLRPEPKEIILEMDPEKLDKYQQISKTCGFNQEHVCREKLLHFLKSKNFKIYDQQKVSDFMKRNVLHAHKNLELGDDLWWQWISLDKYRHPLPLRIAETIKTISFHGADEYYSGKSVFFVSDIVLVTSRHFYNYENTDKHILAWAFAPLKRNTEICFLKVASSTDTLPREDLIIDAWRGPTFSDEEARLP